MIVRRARLNRLSKYVYVVCVAVPCFCLAGGGRGPL